MSDQVTPPSLYAAREPIFPRRVSGPFRNLKWFILIVTLGIYYVVPWIRWDRGPDLPNQAVLLDMANRRFYFFWIEIWSHEFYFVAGLLIMAGLGLLTASVAPGIEAQEAEPKGASTVPLAKRETVQHEFETVRGLAFQVYSRKGKGEWQPLGQA